MISKLNLGAKVLGEDNTDMGTLKFLVANPNNDQITHLVVENGFMDTRRVVVDVNSVVDLADDGKTVYVELTKEQFEKLPDFIEREYTVDRSQYLERANDYGDNPVPASAEVSGLLYPTPGLGIPTGGYGGIDSPRTAITPNAIPDAIMGEAVGPVGATSYTEHMNVPENSMLIQQGADVMATDGKVGKVKSVNLDPNSARIISFTVEKGFFFTEDFVVPVELVREATEEVVNLNMDKEGVRNLPYNSPDDANKGYDRSSM
ncbi:MAG TPA: PRC-barrel domain-containing protein [Chloroflexia bacterium]|nr:PRC-barrel domain-containing protein [Chloroflexia bacterium]